MLRPFAFLFLVLALIFPLHAQDRPIQMTPDFALTFPVTQNGNDVTVKYPIMINPTTVLKPGMVLRTVYVLSYDGNGVTDLVLAHHGDMEESYARSTGSGDGQAKLPPELAHEIEGYRRTVWQVPNNFVLAMAQLPTDTMHLIYSPTGKEQEGALRDERFSFFDGLFVGQPNGGKVTVIAVEKESKAETAGIRAGDEIVSIGGLPTQDNLSVFASGYAAAKKTATDYEASSYALVIRSGGETRQVNIAMPPTLKGGLMDGFTESPKPAPQKPATP